MVCSLYILVIIIMNTSSYCFSAELANTQGKVTFTFDPDERSVLQTVQFNFAITDTVCCSEDIKKLIPCRVVEVKPGCGNFEDI